VRGGAFTVLEARGADPAHVADDPVFGDAVLGAFGLGVR
jgi:hypothetical protein